MILSTSFLALMAVQANSADVEVPANLVKSTLGHVSISTGRNAVRDVENGQHNDANPPIVDLNGSVSYAISENMLIAVDGAFRKDFFDEPRFDVSAGDEDEVSLDWQFMLGGHLLFDAGESSRLGVLAGYGDSRNAEDDAYSLVLLGAEAQTFVSNDLMVYAQAGYGNKVEGNSDDEGFQNGFFGRMGATYFYGDHTALNIDVEHAHVAKYLDGEDDGRFTSAFLNGETSLPASSLPVSLIYRVGYTSIDATTEGDYVEELEVGLGVKFTFGASSPRTAALSGRSLGMPNLPLRASHYTETLD